MFSYAYDSVTVIVHEIGAISVQLSYYESCFIALIAREGRGAIACLIRCKGALRPQN